MRAQWEKVRREWEGNRRLRLGALVALLVVGVHSLLAMDARRQAAADAYADGQQLLVRMEAVGQASDWPARAREIEARYAALTAAIPVVTGRGMARAELQNWLTELAASSSVSEARVRVEDTLEVPGRADMWQVLARLDGKLPQYGHAAFTRALAEALPWVQVDRIEIGEGVPARVSVVVRGYYRQQTAAGGQDGGPAVTPGGVP